MILLRGLAALIAALPAASAIAGEALSAPVDTPQRMLERMDRNTDGKISFEEYRNAMVRRFDARDANHDGVLAGKEFPREWIAGAADFEANGKLTFKGFVDALQPVFDQFDVDHDGQLDANEIAAFAAARKLKEDAKS